MALTEFFLGDETILVSVGLFEEGIEHSGRAWQTPGPQCFAQLMLVERAGLIAVCPSKLLRGVAAEASGRLVSWPQTDRSTGGRSAPRFSLVGLHALTAKCDYNADHDENKTCGSRLIIMQMRAMPIAAAGFLKVLSTTWQSRSNSRLVAN